MTPQKLAEKLTDHGFLPNTEAGRWYETYENGKSVFVGILRNENDCLGHCTVEIDIFNEQDEDYESEKTYISCQSAWNAIKRILNY